MNKYLNFRLIVVLCCLISLTSCHKSLDPASDYIMYDDSKGLIGAGGGQITFNDQNSPLNGSSITFPQGALKKSTLITIKDITADLAVEYKTKIPLALELLPDGLVFNAPPSMKIIVSDKISLEESSFIGPFDKNSGYVLWHKSEVDLSEGTISTEIEHFSLWAYVTNFKITEDDYTYILKNCPKRTCYLGPNLLTECNNDASRSFNKWQTFSNYAGIVFTKSSSIPSDIELEFITASAAKDLFPILNPLNFGSEKIPAGATLINLIDNKRIILLNDDCSWSPSINLGSAWKDTCRVNIERIIEHEIGHNLGLNDLSESDPFSTNSIMGEANVTIPLSICAFDLENLRKEYPEINANTDFQTAFGVEIINPEESTMTCSARQIFTDFFKVKVVDKFGDAVPEVTVVFNLVNSQNNNSLYIEQPAVTTDQNGIATLKSLVLPDIVGTFTLSAKSWTDGEVMASLKESIFQITTITADESKTTDIDGNIYKTVNIGTQTWIAENLKTTKFNDGSVIPLVTESFKWAALMTLKTPGYCWYNYDADMYNSPYGALYNYFTLDVATNGGKNVCPTGWHVPTDTQWTILTTYLGGESVAGSKLKETGTTHWQYQNTDATNETGFTALPGGNCGYDGTFWAFGANGGWWSSTEAGVNGAWYRRMDYSDRGVFRDYYYKHFGFSVRCIKDI